MDLRVTDWFGDAVTARHGGIAQDDIEEAHEAVEKVAEVYEARESCPTARVEAWSFDVVTREETHSTKKTMKRLVYIMFTNEKM